jgi:hypothetical protein
MSSLAAARVVVLVIAALAIAPVLEAAAGHVRCRVGEDLTAKDLSKMDRDFYVSCTHRLTGPWTATAGRAQRGRRAAGVSQPPGPATRTPTPTQPHTHTHTHTQATIVARYGADSRQAQLFVPRRQLGRPAARAAGLGDAPVARRNATAGEAAAPLDASELERLTDWAEAMGAEAAAGAAGGGRRLAQTPGGVRGGVGPMRPHGQAP